MKKKNRFIVICDAMRLSKSSAGNMNDDENEEKKKANKNDQIIKRQRRLK